MVGDAAIDEDHRKLVDVINDLCQAMVERRGRATIGAVLTELAGYVESHFRHEERLMDQTGFPEHEAHRREHIEFIGALANFWFDLELGRNTVVGEVLLWLRRWFTEHVRGTDQRLGAFLLDHAAAA
jgi:hemerythrin-like metal-binding protein